MVYNYRYGLVIATLDLQVLGYLEPVIPCFKPASKFSALAAAAGGRRSEVSLLFQLAAPRRSFRMIISYIHICICFYMYTCTYV